ncbi:MAG: DUF402 domain-containing protein [Armatimonadota bacterium]|nr:DUF402 domain-containing protein [Armatimonadota bacterium]MDR7450230.1 DUF402 domain-containing protein [Armatimonadota bacterium]MDR7460401.1 DUF402 domain-containing protein [Armatimonadota bacterium]MDR7479098.1 DUF402 domain-containing protein [Armatimonadota bacterium]MDR7488987.1 DUF402 domain-containing protein [Armatimonadota bacterium]
MQAVIPPQRVRGRLAFEFVRPPGDRRTLEGLLLEADERMLVLAHPLSPRRPVVVRGETVLQAGDWAVWFLFQGEPFDVGRIYRPDGTWTGYYADVLEPVRWRGRDPATLAPLVDLFLDLWVSPEGDWTVLDEEEFAQAVAAGALTPAQAGHARRVLADLQARTARGAFPPPVVRDFRL